MAAFFDKKARAKRMRGVVSKRAEAHGAALALSSVFGSNLPL